MDRDKAVACQLEEFLTDKLAEKVTESVANDVVARWSESASPRTIKTYLRHIRAAWEWAKGKYHIADPNPWEKCLASRPRIEGSSKPKRKDPFTIAELQAIFVAFSTHKYYKCYLDFATFLVNTGCRLGEAAGLRWKHIIPDFATAEIVASISICRSVFSLKSVSIETIDISLLRFSSFSLTPSKALEKSEIPELILLDNSDKLVKLIISFTRLPYSTIFNDSSCARIMCKYFSLFVNPHHKSRQLEHISRIGST